MNFDFDFYRTEKVADLIDKLVNDKFSNLSSSSVAAATTGAASAAAATSSSMTPASVSASVPVPVPVPASGPIKEEIEFGRHTTLGHATVILPPDEGIVHE